MSSTAPEIIILIKPDDWHIHLRDDEYLARTVPDAAKQFARAVVMPNLNPPIITAEDALAYQKRILAHVPKGLDFHPLMTLYLTSQTTPKDILQAKKNGIIGAKLYPQGATTHSDSGVQDVLALYPVFQAMQDCNLVLQIHGEVVNHEIDIFDREKVFIEKYLINILKNFPQLKIVLEHITTAYAVEFVRKHAPQLAATITPHHLYLNRNDLLVGGIKPHYYCLPIVKQEADRQALIHAAISGDDCFFLGTDSAPHLQIKKESSCGCAGIYSAHAAIELYAQLFEEANALDKLEGFASIFGPKFYTLEMNTQKIYLKKQKQVVPSTLPFGNGSLVPFYAEKELSWQLIEERK